jgi:hypothetical protein
MQLKKRNNPTCVEERNEEAIYNRGRRHWCSTTLLEQDLFYRLYVLVCVDSYSDKHTNPEDELWLSGQSANTVMVGGGFPLPPFSRWTSRLWHFQFHTVKAWERSDGSILLFLSSITHKIPFINYFLLFLSSIIRKIPFINYLQSLWHTVQFLLLIICNLSRTHLIHSFLLMVY